MKRFFILSFLFAFAAMTGCVKDKMWVGPATLSGTAVSPKAPTSSDDVLVSTKISDLKGVTSAKVFYTIGGKQLTVDMVKGADSVYKATIPSQVGNTVVDYYIAVVNKDNLTTYYPTTAPTTPATYTVKAVGAPTISNFKITPSSPTSSDDVVVSATITATKTISATKLIYTVNGGAPTTLNLTASGSTYSATIPKQALNAVVSYYIQADGDGSSTYAPTTAPATPASYKVNAAGAPTVSNVVLNPAVPLAGATVTVTATIAQTQGAGVGTVTLKYGTSTACGTNLTMTASGGTYTATIPANAAGTTVYYYIDAKNADQSSSSQYPATAPATPASYTVTAAAPDYTKLKFNEFAPNATNKSLELYNGGSATLDLTGVYIEKIDEANKTTTQTVSLAGESIAAGTFKVFSNGGTAPYTLANGMSATKQFTYILRDPSGNQLDIFSNCGNAASPKDGTVVPVASPSVYGRATDGSGNWFVMPTATLGSSNNGQSTGAAVTW